MTEFWFALPVLTLLGGLAALAPLGAQVLQRGVVFIDLAVAQAAAAGTLWVNVFYHTHDARMLLPASLFGALLCAATVAWLCRLWPERREALIGLLYIFSAMLALLAAQFSPHGKDNLQQLLAADLLWSSATDAILALGCGTLVVALLLLQRKLFARDVFFYMVFSIVASLMVQLLGVFLVFALLIAPAILLEKRSIVFVAILMSAALILGFYSSWHFDVPSGVSLTLAFALVGLAAGLLKSTHLPPEDQFD